MPSWSCWRSSVPWRTWWPTWTPPTPNSTTSSTLAWRAASAPSTSLPEPWPHACLAAWCVSRASSPSVSSRCHRKPGEIVGFANAILQAWKSHRNLQNDQKSWKSREIWPYELVEFVLLLYQYKGDATASRVSNNTTAAWTSVLIKLKTNVKTVSVFWTEVAKVFGFCA